MDGIERCTKIPYIEKKGQDQKRYIEFSQEKYLNGETAMQYFEGIFTTGCIVFT